MAGLASLVRLKVVGYVNEDPYPTQSKKVHGLFRPVVHEQGRKGGREMTGGW